MTNFFIICLMILPWIFLPIKGVINQFRLPQGMFLNFIFMGMIFFYFLNGAKKVYRNKYLAWFIGYVLLDIFIVFFVPFGIEFEVGGNTSRQINFWVVEPMLHFILGVFATYIVLSTFEKEDFIRVAKAVCWSATLISIWSIMQFLGVDPYGKMATYRCGNVVSACLDNPNLVGNYIALSVPFFFMFLKDKKYIIMLILALGGVYVSKSHFSLGLVSLGILLYVLLKFRNKKVLIGTIIVAMILGGLILKFDYLKLNNGISGRLTCWKYAVEKVKTNPLFGQSLGIWKTYEFKTWDNPKNIGNMEAPLTIWFSTHNDWLQYIIEIGIVGIFLLILVIINSIRNYSFKHEFGLCYLVSFIIFLVMMIGSFPLEVPALGLLGLIAFWGVETL